mmetsp:Transcript_41523/g.61475  ORF Transcript_41523/g.61475 Transcript_41523/m.61475 type:complete len:100 (-) Transcript_41523:70-369(-)
MTYPLQATDNDDFKVTKGNTASGLIKPFNQSTWPAEMFNLSAPRNCPLTNVNVAPQNQQHAFCPGGIGFEKLVDYRDAVPLDVVAAVKPGRNTAIHAPN